MSLKDIRCLAPCWLVKSNLKVSIYWNLGCLFWRSLEITYIKEMNFSHFVCFLLLVIIWLLLIVYNVRGKLWIKRMYCTHFTIIFHNEIIFQYLLIHMIIITKNQFHWISSGGCPIFVESLVIALLSTNSGLTDVFPTTFRSW